MDGEKMLDESIEAMYKRIGPRMDKMMPNNISREILGLLEDTMRHGFEQGKIVGKLEGMKEGAQMVMDNIAKVVNNG